MTPWTHRTMLQSVSYTMEDIERLVQAGRHFNNTQKSVPAKWVRGSGEHTLAIPGVIGTEE